LENTQDNIELKIELPLTVAPNIKNTDEAIIIEGEGSSLGAENDINEGPVILLSPTITGKMTNKTGALVSI
jgi:hypothetical protein